MVSRPCWKSSNRGATDVTEKPFSAHQGKAFHDNSVVSTALLVSVSLGIGTTLTERDSRTQQKIVQNTWRPSAPGRAAQDLRSDSKRIRQVRSLPANAPVRVARAGAAAAFRQPAEE